LLDKVVAGRHGVAIGSRRRERRGKKLRAKERKGTVRERGRIIKI
jgi:hypothetical protein